jgi:hypothetical protein
LIRQGREELPSFGLQAPGKRRRLHEGFLDFDRRLVVVVELEDDVGESFEIWVDGAVQGQLGVARIETALLRVVVADFESIQMPRSRRRRNCPSNERLRNVFPPPAMVTARR